jgi:hypothetical protein
MNGKEIVVVVGSIDRFGSDGFEVGSRRGDDYLLGLASPVVSKTRRTILLRKHLTLYYCLL